jgi:hypothetical protein
MNSVAPSRRPSAFTSSEQGGGWTQRLQRAAVALHRRARTVGRQLQQRRRAGQRAPPVRQLPLQRSPVSQRALPRREVRVLQRGLRQRRRARRARRRRRAPSSSRWKHAQRPPVATAWWKVAGGRARRRPCARARAEERPARQVEGRRGVFRRQAGAPRPAARAGTRRRRSCTGRSPRPGAGRTRCTGTPSTAREDGAQRLVAAHHLAPARGAARPRPAGRAAARDGMAYSGVPRLQAVQEPEPLLRERHRQVAAADGHQRTSAPGGRRPRRAGGRPRPPARPEAGCSKTARSGRSTPSRRHARPRAWPAASARPGRRSRPGAHALHPQHLGPDPASTSSTGVRGATYASAVAAPRAPGARGGPPCRWG